MERKNAINLCNLTIMPFIVNNSSPETEKKWGKRACVPGINYLLLDLVVNSTPQGPWMHSFQLNKRHFAWSNFPSSSSVS